MPRLAPLNLTQAVAAVRDQRMSGETGTLALNLRDDVSPDALDAALGAIGVVGATTVSPPPSVRKQAVMPKTPYEKQRKAQKKLNKKVQKAMQARKAAAENLGETEGVSDTEVDACLRLIGSIEKDTPIDQDVVHPTTGARITAAERRAVRAAKSHPTSSPGYSAARHVILTVAAKAVNFGANNGGEIDPTENGQIGQTGSIRNLLAKQKFQATPDPDHIERLRELMNDPRLDAALKMQAGEIVTRYNLQKSHVSELGIANSAIADAANAPHHSASTFASDDGSPGSTATGFGSPGNPAAATAKPSEASHSATSESGTAGSVTAGPTVGSGSAAGGLPGITASVDGGESTYAIPDEQKLKKAEAELAVCKDALRRDELGREVTLGRLRKAHTVAAPTLAKSDSKYGHLPFPVREL